jgi:hypothetical protein
MDRQYIRDNQVIERYLAGALTAGEEQAFEEAYLGNAELLAEIETAERLRDGVKGLDSAGTLERSRPRWQQALASPRYALAASMLLAVSLGFSTMLYQENRDLREGGSSLPMITQFVALGSVRGGNENQIAAPAPNELIVLSLDGGTVAYDTYRAVLMRRDGERSAQIWSLAGLSPQPDGTIAVGLTGRSLPPGSYEAVVQGRMNDWPAERFEDSTRASLTVAPRD